MENNYILINSIPVISQFIILVGAYFILRYKDLLTFKYLIIIFLVFSLLTLYTYILPSWYYFSLTSFIYENIISPLTNYEINYIYIFIYISSVISTLITFFLFFIPLRIYIYKNKHKINYNYIIYFILLGNILSYIIMTFVSFNHITTEFLLSIGFNSMYIYLLTDLFLILISKLLLLKIIFININSIKKINNWNITILKYSISIFFIIIFYIFVKLLTLTYITQLVLFVPTLFILLYFTKWELIRRNEWSINKKYLCNKLKLFKYILGLLITITFLWIYLFQNYLLIYILYNLTLSIVLTFLAFRRRSKMFNWEQLTLLWITGAYIFPVFYLPYLYSLEEETKEWKNLNNKKQIWDLD